MTAGFTFSKIEGAKFPDHCRAATMVWSDIAKTMMSPDAIGAGTCDTDGSVHIKHETFEITLMPNGQFFGKRLTAKDHPEPHVEPTEEAAPH